MPIAGSATMRDSFNRFAAAAYAHFTADPAAAHGVTITLQLDVGCMLASSAGLELRFSHLLSLDGQAAERILVLFLNPQHMPGPAMLGTVGADGVADAPGMVLHCLRHAAELDRAKAPTVPA